MQTISMSSLFSSPPSTHSRPKTHLFHTTYDHQNSLSIQLNKPLHPLKCSVTQQTPALVEKEEPFSSNGSAPAPAETVLKFEDPKWVNGTWDLSQFPKDDWDAVIDAEARRRKWLESNPESSNNDEPVVFDTSIIPWWAWMKRFHLPEAELLNGRAAMIGFFMTYFVDGLTGVGLVDQMDNFFCKTLLFIAVGGVLLIRKNEDLENVKILLEESTFYDKQWQATWQDDSSSNSKNKQ